METVRGILAAHPSGISRAGILAWAKLRIDPDFDEARLDAELAALGAEVVEQDGFLWLSSAASAPRPAPESMAWTAPIDVTEPVASPASGPPSQRGVVGVEGGVESWRAPVASAETPVPAQETSSWTLDGGSGTAVPGAPTWTAPARRTARTGGWIFGLAVAAIIVVSNLVGSLVGDRSSDTPGPTGPGSSVMGSTGPVEDLSIGDCIGVPTADEFSELQFVPCDSPHDAEVFFVGERPGSTDAYPDEGAFESWVQDTCYPAFEDYTGSAFDDQTALDVGWFTPTESSWQNGDRVVHCYLAPADGTTTSMSWRGADP